MYSFQAAFVKKLCVCVLAAAAILPAHADTHYVNKANVTGAFSPYTNWATAATNIQDAVNQAVAGDTVLVTNGVYDTGGAVRTGYVLTNRVLIGSALTLRSVSSNPADTVIVGAADPVSGSNGLSAVRCVNIYANGASIMGFTMTNGHTSAGGLYLDVMGGGLLFGYYDTYGLVSNCVIVDCTADATGNWGGGGFSGGSNVTNYNCRLIGNSSRQNGGAAYMGIFIGCVISNNSCALSGGGLYLSRAFDCTIVNNHSANNAGGFYNCSLVDRCIVQNNYAGVCGGGAWCSPGTIRNSLFTGNTSASQGGALYAGQQILNCTIVSNYAAVGGGVRATSALTNCIVYYNTPNNLGPASQTYSMSYSCVPTNELTTSLIIGSQNITNHPLFIAATNGNYRLVRLSPCVNTGLNQDWMTNATDLDGRDRIISGIVDMGAFEYNPPPVGTIFSSR